MLVGFIRADFINLSGINFTQILYLRGPSALLLISSSRVPIFMSLLVSCDHQSI